MIKLATTEAKRPFCNVVLRFRTVWSQLPGVASHQDQHRVRIARQAINEFLVKSFCL